MFLRPADSSLPAACGLLSTARCANPAAREVAREHASQATEMLQEKNREVEWLRAQKAADDVSILFSYGGGLELTISTA